MKLELTDQEAQALISLIDMSVKAGGLNVASTALFMAEKINKAIRMDKNPLEIVQNEQVGTA